MAQNVLITPASTKVAFTDAGDVTTVLRTSSGRFEFKDSGESNFVDIYANDIVLDGNLTVGGTTTTVNTSSVLIEDPILQLAKGQTSGTPTVDIGFLGLRGASNNAAFIWDESDDVFAAILTTDDASGTTLAPASYADFKAGAATFSGALTGLRAAFTGANGSNYALHIKNTTTASPYTCLIEERGSPTAVYPLLNVTSSGGTNNYFRIDSGTGKSFFGGQVELAGGARLMLGQALSLIHI